MENTNQTKQAPDTLTKSIVVQLILSSAISLFWVIFLWNFWSKGVYALGINVFIFLALLITLFVWALYKQEKIIAGDLIWLMPIFLIALSFALYDNPFLKIISIIIFPIIFAFSYNQANIENKNLMHWNIIFLIKILGRILTFFVNMGNSVIWYLELIIPAGKAKKRIIA